MSTEIKLPEGIRFTAEDFQKALYAFREGRRGMTIAEYCAEQANAKLPALFEEWVKREGVKVYGSVEFGWWDEQPQEKNLDGHHVDTHQAYLMLPTEIGK